VEEPLYEEVGPRRPKRPSISNLDVISENRSSQLFLLLFFSTVFLPSLLISVSQIRTDQPEEVRIDNKKCELSDMRNTY
jgi:hypothetical protein